MGGANSVVIRGKGDQPLFTMAMGACWNYPAHMTVGALPCGAFDLNLLTAPEHFTLTLKLPDETRVITR
jgi:hypothetical protein